LSVTGYPPVSAGQHFITTRYSQRLDKLRAALKGVDGLFITNLTNIHYLTGFRGTSAFLLIGQKEAFFITDARYGKDSVPADGLYEIIIIKQKLRLLLKKLLKKASIKKLGFEKKATFALYERLKKTGVELKPLKGPVEDIRIKKDPEELAEITGAVKRAEEAFLKIKPYIKPGVKETQLASRLEGKLRAGCLCELPFPAIVASGPANSAIPHARPTERKLASGDLVVIDWGAWHNGYFSDMTRTLLLPGGPEMAKKRRIYQTVLRANKAGIASVSPGKRAKEIDNSARYVIKQADYGAYVVHSLGHGVGLEVHEAPGLSAVSADTLSEGMVFTIEPGIYIPGVGGVRIEDMVHLGPKRAQVLTSLPKDLESITLGGH
jgi:Xaa-Pro aminopeptidase